MPTKKVAYIYPENLSNAAIREIFDHHWRKIPVLKKPGRVKIADLQREMLSFHTANGGQNKVAGKAVTRMVIQYSKSNPDKIKPTTDKGHWLMNLGKQKLKKVVLKAAKPTPPKKDLMVIRPVKVFGRGDYFVYVFFDNKSVCKIGKTLNVQQRYQTLSTAWHKPWSHPFQIRLASKEYMQEYEKAIHSILKMNGFYINNKSKQGGNELFRITSKRLSPFIFQLNKILKIRLIND